MEADFGCLKITIRAVIFIYGRNFVFTRYMDICVFINSLNCACVIW